jgi:hypothetical protein
MRVMHDAAADSGSHGSQTRAAEEAPAGYVRAPTEHNRVGALGVFGVEFVYVSLECGHAVLPDM